MDTIPAKSAAEKWLIALTVMMVAVMQVLDMTIVNVALPNMMGSFGSTVSEITWVITAYVVASAIVMPLTGFLVANFGRKRILLLSVLGFMLTSIMCGISTSLVEIILFRTLQGVFGAALIPLSQFILRDTFPRNELSKAMAVWAMGIMVGPVLGPTLGGYLTEHLTWHWVFFINVPVCVIAFVLTLSMITESPLDKKPVDWLGILSLMIGVGCLQTFLEDGYRQDWFASNAILALFIGAIFGIAVFIINSINNPTSVIKMSIFRDRQFVSCTLLMTLFSLALFGSMVLQPLMTQILLNYPPSEAGLIMAPRGLVSLIFMPFVPLLMKRFNAKWLIALGIFIIGYGSWLMSGWNLNISMSNIVFDTIVQGFGMSLVFTPLSSIVFDTLPQEDIASAAGMFSFARNMGLSIGVALFSTVLSNESQINWNQLGGHINPMNPSLWHWLQANQLTLHNPLAAQELGNVLLSQQSSMIAYLDIYWLAAMCFWLMIPLVLLIKNGRVTSSMVDMH